MRKQHDVISQMRCNPIIDRAWASLWHSVSAMEVSLLVNQIIYGASVILTSRNFVKFESKTCRKVSKTFNCPFQRSTFSFFFCLAWQTSADNEKNRCNATTLAVTFASIAYETKSNEKPNNIKRINVLLAKSDK
jgi:hypothetical protein